MTQTRPTVAILAGGRSERFTQGSAAARPKALARVGGRALIDLVVDRYARCGHRDVLVVLGHHHDQIASHLASRDDGTRLHLLDTGLEADTGTRVLRASEHLASTFHLAWCDGLLDLDPTVLDRAHRGRSPGVTMVVAHPPTRFGRVWLEGDAVVTVEEKPVLDDVWVSAGMFVVDAHALPDRHVSSSWERDVLPRLAKDGRLHAHRHEGFWAAIDTPDDLQALQRRVQDQAPWLT